MTPDYNTVKLRMRVALLVWFMITGFITTIWLLATYAHGPYHPDLRPKQVCLRAHDVYRYDSDYKEWHTKQVCDDYGTVYPGTTPTPDPSSSAVGGPDT